MKKIILVGMILFIAIMSYAQYPRDQKIMAAEYFYNVDPGEGNGTPVDVGISADVTVNLSNLNVPVNTRIYIRFQSTNGTWSAPRCIKRMEYFPITGATIAYGEYFVNNDPGVGNGTPISFSNGTASLNNQNLEQGDIVYFRIRDSFNRWSPARGFRYQFKEMRRADYRIRLASTGNYTTPVVVPTSPAPDNTCPYSCSKNNITWHTDDSLFIRYQTKEGFFSSWVNGIVAYAGGDQTICQGSSATLTASGGQSYQWSDGQAGSTITVTPDITTTFYVTVSSGQWITSVDSVTVFVLPGPVTPVITPAGPTTFCDGNSVVLNCTTGEGYTYQWYRNGIMINGAVAPSCAASQSGNYTVTVTLGCPSTSLPITIIVNPLPPTPVLTQNGNLLSSSAETGNQWYFNDQLMEGEINQTINAVNIGNYYVIVTLNGCISAPSNIVQYTSADDIQSPINLIVYPNPCRGEFIIKGEIEHSVDIAIKVIDCIGNIVYYSSDKKYTHHLYEKIQIPNAVPGLYQLIIGYEQKIIRGNIVILDR